MVELVDAPDSKSGSFGSASSSLAGGTTSLKNLKHMLEERNSAICEAANSIESLLPQDFPNMGTKPSADRIFFLS